MRPSELAEELECDTKTVRRYIEKGLLPASKNYKGYNITFWDAKELKQKHSPDILENGDTLKQLLARSRYLLFKSEDNWTPTQRWRSELLFARYPALEQAHKLAMQLGNIFSKSKTKGVAFTKLAKWYDRVDKSGFKSFNTVAKSIEHHYQTILNFFDNRSTNASAESFNAKIKAFRSSFRGVRNVNFFLYRLANIYA